MQFKFRKNASIGVAQAELDTKFLYSCFVDSGALEVAMDCQDARMFINGRVGSGKSALLLKILHEKPAQTIVISPETLALSHITNSDILKFFEELGVRLDPFYKLLWRHVLTVELIKKRFRINTEEAKKSFLSTLMSTFKKDKKKEKAFQYIDDWGEKFWKDTEYRIVETTKKIERQLQGALDSALGKALNLSILGKINLTDEEKAEVIKKGKEIVNKVQIAELNEIIEWLSEELSDPMKPYYIVIDKLDEDWVEEQIRNKLILALLEAAKDFFEIDNLKVLVAIRRDLLERLFKLHRAAGHQEEKYQSLCLNMQWSQNDLMELLDKRVDHLVREEYTKASVKLIHLLPSKILKEDPIEYILDRTFLRPRDAISFVNECLRYCTGKPKLTQHIIVAAEKDYSAHRFRSVGDEWHKNYPNLLTFARMLYNRPDSFDLKEVTEENVDELILGILTTDVEEKDDLWRLADSKFKSEKSFEEFINDLFTVFYKVGFVGLRKASLEPVQWSYINEPFVYSEELSAETKVHIHKAFWRVFRTKFPAK